MDREWAREEAFEATKKDTNLLGAWDEGACPYDHKAMWLSGYDAGRADATRKHIYWAAGEPDCPGDIKAGNGELHTLRCKVCGLDNSKDSCKGEKK